MRKKILPLLAVIAALSGALPLHAAKHVKVAITWPRDGAALPWRPCISGTVSDPTAEVWLIVNDKSGNFYVEPGPVSIKRGGTWSGRPYIAEKRPDLFTGLNMEIQAIANPADHLAEGMVLSHWPSAQASSGVLDIVYRDDAGDGCLTGTADSGASDNHRSLTQPDDSAHVPSQPVANDHPPAVALSEFSFWQPAMQALTIVLGLLFIALVAMPHLAEAAIRRLSEWLKAFTNGLVKTVLIFKHSIVWLSSRLFKVSQSQTRQIWEKKGFTFDFRILSFQLLAIAPLYLSLVVAFYSESATNVRSLNELFGIESNATSDVQQGLAAGLMDSSSAGSPATEPHATATEPEQNSLRRIPGKWVTRLNTAFERLWELEPLGFLAMALAALQASFSIVLLWGMKFTEPLKLRLRTLLQDRPLLTQAFLGLTLALAALAAFRGARVTVGPSWVLAMIVSAALGLVLPIILGVTAHYAQDATTDWFAVAKVCSVIVLLNIGLGAIIALWALVLLLITVAIGLTLLCFAAFFVLAGGYLLFAETMGLLVKEVRGFRIPQVKSANAAGGAALMLMMILAIAALVALLVIRG